MNASQKGKDSGRSGVTRSKLLGASGHVHNPFSTKLHGSHDVEAYRKDMNTGELGVVEFEAEMAKIQAGIVAQTLIARFQKS